MSEGKEIKEEERKQYVNEGGGYCPYCKSHQYEGGSLDFECGNIYQTMLCNECGESWVDCYTLSNVLE